MSLVGQAYKEYLTPEEQEALAGGVDLLLDGLFDEVMQMAHWEESDLANSTFGWHLPPRYLPKYTPLFLKQFLICVVTVAWKLAQPEPMVLSCVAEELAGWAIINAARVQIELKRETEGASEVSTEDAFADFIEVFFEDTDCLFLFDDEYDGIDQSPVGQMFGLTPLSFEDWFKPFGSGPERIVHPYVAGEE
jgi:hypothetical protein